MRHKAYSVFLVCKNAQTQKQAKSPEKPDTARDAARFYVYVKVRIFAKKRTFLTLKNAQVRRGAAYRRVNSKKTVIFSQKYAHKIAPKPLPHKGLAGITTRESAKNA
ncbi:hypothetical protein BZZ87_001290 [Salmonella enterica subsp. enterica serovar 4,[5],12:b:-]|nr:hypothetical protein [Salmonella enterica subsp. enterica serovar 4,[5],12:b:-]